MRNSSGIYSISEVPSFVKGFRKMTDQDFDPRTPCGVRQGSSIAITARGHFNPRTPCGVRRDSASGNLTRIGFQSTHPMRGATLAHRSTPIRVSHFNPRTPCGVRLRSWRLLGCGAMISIHAPLAGCDPGNAPVPTTPNISIHAPLAGCDGNGEKHGRHDGDFNPRTPCGVRRSDTLCRRSSPDFNPRTPCGVRPVVVANFLLL